MYIVILLTQKWSNPLGSEVGHPSLAFACAHPSCLPLLPSPLSSFREPPVSHLKFKWPGRTTLTCVSSVLSHLHITSLSNSTARFCGYSDGFRDGHITSKGPLKPNLGISDEIIGEKDLPLVLQISRVHKFFPFAWASLNSLSLVLCYCYSVVQSCPTLCDPMDCSMQASLAFTVSQSLFKLMSIELMMPSNHLIHCHSFLLLPSIFPSIRVFVMSWLFVSGGQSIGVSPSASVLLMNIQDWFPLGLTSLISLLSKGLSRVFSSTAVQRHQFFGAQPSLWSNSHIRTWLLEKP